MWGRVPRRRLAGGTPVDYANDIRVIDGRGDNYSKVWIRGAYLRDITRQIAISRADLHRTCRDVASPNEMCIIYVRTSVCARAQVFSRRVEMDRGDETFLIMIRRVSQSIEWNSLWHFSIISVANWLKILGMVIFFSIQIIRMVYKWIPDFRINSPRFDLGIGWLKIGWLRKCWERDRFDGGGIDVQSNRSLEFWGPCGVHTKLSNNSIGYWLSINLTLNADRVINPPSFDIYAKLN